MTTVNNYTSIYLFLKNYSSDVDKINRLLVSAFVKTNNLKKVNLHIEQYLIHPEDFEEHEVLVDFLNLLKKKGVDLDIEKLLELFEFVISPADKVVTGAVFTPKNIRRYIVKEVFNNINKNKISCLLICDIACGCGGFLIDAAKFLKQKTGKSYKSIFEKNIFGLDIKNYSIERTKILLNLLMLQEREKSEKIDFNLYTGNALSFNWHKIDKIKKNNGFDAIVSNPPYVCARKIDEESKKLLSNWEVCSVGLPDLYIPFFQIGYESLNENGVLGFITMNTFFKSLNATALRQYFSKNKVNLKIIDFGGEQIFKSKTTYTCLVFINKRANSHVQYTHTSSDKITSLKNKDFSVITYDKLDDDRGWNLRSAHLINRIENTGVALGEIYNIKSGIATLRDHIYIIKPVSEDKKYYYLKTGHKIEKEICKKVINSNKLTNETVDLHSIVFPIIFPYIYEKKRLKIIDEETLKKSFPNAYAYLLEHKEVLSKRDKSNGNYPEWYAYGRTQNLEKFRFKMFFPHLAKDIPNYYITEEDLLHVNGRMVVGETQEELIILKKIMSSSIFWFYIKNTSKRYSSGYYSLAFRYLKNFGIPIFSKKEQKILLKTERQEDVDGFLYQKYGISSRDSGSIPSKIKI